MLFGFFNLISLIGSSLGTIMLSILLAVWGLIKDGIGTSCFSIHNHVTNFDACVCNKTIDHSVTFGKEVYCQTFLRDSVFHILL